MQVVGGVYILSNPSMPGILKIGMTNRHSVEARIEELSSGSVPTPFKAEFFLKHEYPQALEALIHRKLAEYRIATNREFFLLPVRTAIAKIKNLALESAEKEQIAAISGRKLKQFRTMAELGDSIRAIRKGLGMTQLQLAGVTNVGIRFIVDIENGKSTAQIGLVLKVCNSMGLLLAVDATPLKSWESIRQTALSEVCMDNLPDQEPMKEAA